MSALIDKVDAARALYKGVMLVGHRATIDVGRMLWAIPGRTFATTRDLNVTGAFEKLIGPSEEEITAYVNPAAAVPEKIVPPKPGSNGSGRRILTVRAA